MIIENLLKKIDTSIIDDSVYNYNGNPIPRVSNILSNMLHEEYLMKWANNIGLYQRCNYANKRDEAAFVGTLSHNNIETYIGDGSYDLSKYDLNSANYNKVYNAVESFIKWFTDISNNKVDILGIENQLVCPYYGGTYDMKIAINDKIYLTDFKTSNHISYKYFLQLAAYNYILKLRGEKIDGFIILQVSKTNIGYNEYVLNMDNPESFNFMQLCEETFLSLVYAYYNRLHVEKEFDRLFK